MEEMLGIPVIPISAAKNEGIDELVEHAIHVAKYQEQPRTMDLCDVNDDGGAVHRCLHAIMHLIEDHAKAAGIPLRFAASKLAEGDSLIMNSLNLDENEKETLRAYHYRRWKQSAAWTVQQPLHICALILLQKPVMLPLSSQEKARNICAA